jgi:hypothetical protein
MTIRYEDGSTAHAIIFGLTGRNLRAAVEGFDNPVDFRLIGRQWIASSGAAVTFEFPVEIGTEFFEILTDLAFGEEEGHCTTGGDCLIRRMADAGNHARPN